MAELDVTLFNVAGRIDFSTAEIVAGNIRDEHLATDAALNMFKLDWKLGPGLTLDSKTGELHTSIWSGMIKDKDIHKDAQIAVDKTRLSIFISPVTGVD